MDHYKRSSLNCFVSNSFDRLTHKRGDSTWIQERLLDPSTGIIPVWNLKNLFRKDSSTHALVLPSTEIHYLLPAANSVTLLGEQTDRIYFAVDFPGQETAAPPVLDNNGFFSDLRAMGPIIDCCEGALLAYARAMSYWHSTHRFCGNCGKPTTSTQAGHMRVCSNAGCGQQHFPRTDPAIIVLVTNGERALLGRQAAWPKHMYSAIAGFVEPGESIEAAVVREVSEEAGMKVNNIHYHSSQPWPFPCSIMLGFTADTQDKEIRMNDSELEDARWFSTGGLKSAIADGSLKLPSAISIAYRLIEDWFDSVTMGSLKGEIETPVYSNAPRIGTQ